MLKKSTQFAEQLGNDYLQKTEDYFVTEKDGKSTYRDGIYTYLKDPVGDPDGLNKRIINVNQADWGDIDEKYESLSGETDGSALLTSGYAAAEVYGTPFQKEANQAPIEKKAAEFTK